MAAKPQAPPSEELPKKCKGLELDDTKQKEDMPTPNTSVTDVALPLSSPSITPLPSCAIAQTCKEVAESERQSLKDTVEEKVEERKRDVDDQTQKKLFWLEKDDLPPMM